MPELLSGVITAIMAKSAAQAQAKTGEGIALVADAIAHQAQVNASTGSHPYRTKTPAHPGTGPATISGALVSSVTFTPPLPIGSGWECRIGPRSGVYPSYSSRTPASKYGFYLETGLRNGTRYPWLEPASRIGHIVSAPLFQRAFSSPWL